MSKTTPKLSEVAKKYGFKDEKAIYGTWNGYSICIDNFADEDDPPRISASVSRAGQKPTKDVVDSALSNAEHLGYVRIKGWMISVNLPDSVKVIARDFVLILDELTRSLSAAGLQNCDSKTGKVGPTQFYRINGRLTILSEESFQREIQAAAERRERYEHTKERYPLGICGALLASIAAGMLYILLRGILDKGACFLTIFVGFAALKSYGALAHRASLVGFLSAGIIPLPVMYIFVRAYFCTPLIESWELSPLDAFLNVPAGIKEGLISASDYHGDLVICAILLIFNAMTLILQYRRWNRYHDTAEAA